MFVWKIWKKPSIGFLAGYAFMILTETVLIRKSFTGVHLKLELIWSWRVWDKQNRQILTNIVMYVPAGILAGKLWKWKGLRVAAWFSVTIEVLQLVTARGLCEFDDILHNCIGAVIGVGVVMGIRKMIEVEASE